MGRHPVADDVGRPRWIGRQWIGPGKNDRLPVGGQEASCVPEALRQAPPCHTDCGSFDGAWGRQWRQEEVAFDHRLDDVGQLAAVVVRVRPGAQPDKRHIRPLPGGHRAGEATNTTRLSEADRSRARNDRRAGDGNRADG
jgi:hypothetical protein